LSNTPGLCSSLNVWDQVSYPYSTTGKIIQCKIWGFHGGDYDDYHLPDDNHQNYTVFMFFGRGPEDKRFWIEW
jgi:hypothetical protein